MRLTLLAILMTFTIYNACGSVDDLAKNLRISVKKLFKWLKDNRMNGNTDRFHLILNTGDSNQM